MKNITPHQSAMLTASLQGEAMCREGGLFMTFFNIIKNPFNFKEGDKKKKIDNLVIILVVLVIIMIVGSYLFGGDEADKDATMVASVARMTFDEREFETRLCKILSKINGAGKVSVMVSYKSSPETVPLLDTKDNSTTTEENQNSGSSKKTEQKQSEATIIFNQEKSGDKVPYISKSIMPQVEGVVVIAEGGKDINVKADLVSAVCAVTGVSANKVQVFEGR